MYFVSGHYRKPIDFSPEALDQARRSVARIRELARRIDGSAPPVAGADELEARFYAALEDDFNTPQALSIVFELVAEANRRLGAGEQVGPGPMREMLWVLGLDNLLDQDSDAPDADAERLLAEREEARAARDFATADARRDELAALGWEVRDTPEGPKLVRRD
jgi:cysteinyl-tRNA synthetase